MSVETVKIRNISLSGHGGTGKTSLTEALLVAAGVIAKAETVESGKTVSDYTPEESERGMSVHTSVAAANWLDQKINLFDTPGSSDFIGEVVAAFRTTETACMVVGADTGVQIETIKLWRRLDVRKMPRMVFVNKMDKDNADFARVIEDLKDKFKANFVPVSLPVGQGASFKGVVGLINNQEYLCADGKEKAGVISDDMKDQAEEARNTLIEAAAEGDDEIMEKFFEKGTLTEDDMRKGLQESFCSQAFIPVFCGSAIQGSGASTLLNFVTTACPSPEGIDEAVKSPEGEETSVPISVNSETSLLVFKTTIDQFSGKLSFFKVMAGEVTSDSDLINLSLRKKERVSKLFFPTGKKLAEVKTLKAGDIGVAAKLDSVHTNSTLAATEDSSTYIPLRLPQPVHAVAINATAKKDEDKMNEFLHRASEEDATFTMSYNKETKETVIAGMGELHINMILDKLRDKQKIEVETRTPKIAYRETITKPANAEYTHKKQSGGHGQYGRVVIEVKPLQRGEQFSFANAIRGQAVSKGYMPGIEKGLLEGMEEGYVAGYPIVDLGAKVVDGKEHPVDSSEMAFKLAAKGALKACMEKASPALLEPVMQLRVFADEQFVGDILSDMSSRRGRVLGQNPLGGGITEIDAQVPQSELLRYSIDLRSITSGTASFEVEFDHYSPISGKVAEAVIAASKNEDS